MTGRVAKVLVFATSARGLLVFEEPDFPEVGLQVPGGTVEPNESAREAAAREFHEETGLPAPSNLTEFHTDEILPPGTPEPVRRVSFHVGLKDGLPLTWDHLERHPCDSTDPILFRFRFLPIEGAPTDLGGAQGHICAKLATWLSGPSHPLPGDD